MRAILWALLSTLALTNRTWAANDWPLALWYSSPATDWEREALPIGNGAMGAMVFGGTSTERLQFNEKTLWSGGPGSKAGYDFGIPSRSMAAKVRAVAGRLENKSRLAPEEVARELGREPRGYGDYLSFGDLFLEFAPSNAPVLHYRRELDLASGIARVEYTQAGVKLWREYFASYPDGVIVVRLGADQAGKINFRARLEIQGDRSTKLAVNGGRVTAGGTLNDNGLRFEAQVQVLNTAGTRSELDGGQVAVEGADEALIILSAGTNYALHYPDYRGEDPHVRVQQRVDEATSRGAAQLRERHIADHRALFDRVSLDIGQQPVVLPTDQALREYGQKTSLGRSEVDRWLEALYFQYGRYLLIASSRAGSLPANLQGVWNHSDKPPWNADYHININLQMNYWPAQATNLQETADPLFEFVEALVEPGQRAAGQILGAQGWTAFLNTNIYGYAGVISWPTAFWQPEAAGWLAQHFYEHYLFTRDEAFLRERAWPVMREATRFWLDVLRTDSRTGQLLVTLSYSPEHGPFTAGASMSQQIVFDLLVNTDEAARILGDSTFAARVDAALAKLDPGLRIGSWGQLQEWRVDYDDPKNDHRHVSHLFALHPGRQISPYKTPKLAQAARVSLEARGDGGTGWSKAWKVNFWARLLDGDRAHKLLGEQLRSSTLPNLLDTHPPFQIDGNFGATAGIAEMLLQSHTGELHLLPALPSAWPFGSVAGLRARGDVTVDIRWSGGQAVEAKLKTGSGGTIRIRSTLLTQPYRLVDRGSGAAVSLRVEGGDTGTFVARPAAEYLLQRL